MQIEINPSMFFDQELLEQTAEQLKDEVRDAQVIPKNQGILEESLHTNVHPELRRADVVVSAPYARRLYVHPEYDFRRGENGNKNLHANAKGQWFEDWEPGGSLECRAAQIYSDLWKKKYGGGT